MSKPDIAGDSPILKPNRDKKKSNCVVEFLKAAVKTDDALEW